MNIDRWLISSITALQALIIALMMVTGPVFAQEPEPGEAMDALLVKDQKSEEETTDTQFAVEAAAVGSRIPIQGRLTNDSGTPLNGTYSVVFTFYDAATGGTALCYDINSVIASNGVFNSEIWGTCGSGDFNGQQVYLGIKVGSDVEMTPRLPVYPVPYAFSLKPNAIVQGEISAAILHLENSSPSGRGLRSWAMSETGTNYGVVGASRSPDGYGGYFYNNGGGTGLYGHAITETGEAYGVHGKSDANSGRGVYGYALGTNGYGVLGEAPGANGRGVSGFAPGTYGYGVYGSAQGSHGYAGWFLGDVHVTGTLSKYGGGFKIDHPLEPENKYLNHSFVESPDMMNMYNGNVVLNHKGEAWVELPEWFETLNKDFRYQLTAIGAPGPNLYIDEEISENRFRIAGGTPEMKVSWQVTGIRQDPWANANRIPVEENKTDKELGYYLHPESYGQPEEKGIEWARDPEGMQRMKEEREKRQASTS